MKNLFKMKKVLYTLSMLFCLLGVSESAWAGSDYNTAMRAIVAEEDTGKGLVYASTNSSATPTYRNIVKSGNNQPGDESIWTDFYVWAQPARGFKFNKWVIFDFFTIAGYASDGNGSIETIADGKRRGREVSTNSVSIKANTGTHDNVKGKSWGGGAGDDVCGTVKADWVPATGYVVTYKQPVGGSYNVSYSYQTVNPGSSYFAAQDAFTTSTENYDLTPTSGDWKPYGITDDQHDNGYSYAADVVTLSSAAGNFVAWEEDGEVISTANPYTYIISKNANVKALFKWIEPVAPEEKLVRTTNNSADVNESVVFSMDNIVSTWATADFNVTLVDPTGSGIFTLGAISYDATDKELTVNFTYNANSKWEEGSSVTIQVAPVNASYGTTASVLVKAIAQQNSLYQARVSGEGFATQEGDLTDMLAIANTKTDATLTLLQSVAVSSPLVISKSMTLDLNNWILSSTAASRVISVEGTDTKLTVVDNSYLKGSEIQLTRSVNAEIAAIEVTGSNRLVYNHGKMTVANTITYSSDNKNGKANGIYVSGAGNAVMQGGSISVQSDHSARGVLISSTGNATLNVGKIEASANAYAYAIYSGGKINVAEGISLKASTTGDGSSTLYMNGGTAVVDNVTITSTAGGKNAYGARVDGGKLTLNGGTIIAKAATPNVYGAYVAAGASATIQQQANITAELTTDAAGSATAQAYGVQNLGTLKLINSTVKAISLKNYATAVESKTSATSTTIEGGTYTAQSATGYAYGLHHQFGILNVDGGTFSAVAAGNNIYGARAGVDGTIANATILAESTDNGKTVYGFVGGVTNKNISLTNCTIKAKSATSAAYGIYSRANVTATGCALEAKTASGASAYGLYAENGTNALVNTSAVVEAFTTDAYGVDFAAGTLSVNGGTFDVTARQAVANAVADSKVFGVRIANGKTATLSNATFNVSAPNNSFSQKAYGVYTGSGTCNSTNCTYDVSVRTQAYGIYAEGSSTLNLSNDNITATTTVGTTAYGIYSNGGFTINESEVISHTKTYTSYPLVFGASAHGEVLGGKFKAEGVSNAADQVLSPVNKTASASNVAIKGGFFYDIPNVRYYVPDGYDIYGVDPSAPEYAQKYYYTVNDHLPYENVCYITEANVGFPTLAEAFDYARNHTEKNYNIIMTQPYTLPAGNYLLPSNAILVVPYLGTQTTAKANNVIKTREVKMIAENRCLTIAANANIDVQGAIEASADELIDAAGSVGYVQGPYGRIHMESGSTITLNSGAKLYAYGYITGAGEIRAKNGATVYEDFQTHDMKGAKDLDDNWIDNAQKTFPVNQYYIQNIEVPTKYYYGAKLYGKFGYVAANMTVGVQDVEVLGTATSFFHVDSDDESSWVRKSYNPTTDRILWETNSSASLGSMSIEISGYSFNSKDYILPLTNNMTIHALSGLFTITQSTVMLPGAEIIIDKTATLKINEKDTKNEAMGLYLYDQSQWTTDAKPIKYSPSWSNGTCPRSTAASKMKDAAIYVKGKIQVDGFIHTTAGGAAIYSDDTNAGTIEFNADATGDKTIYKTYASTTNVTTNNAQLRNGGVSGATFTATKDVAEDGDTYAYMDIDNDGVYTWTNLATLDECVVQDKNTSVYYAKPQGYVAIDSDTEDANHLFHSEEGERLFIQQFIDAGCVWWEVTQVGETSVYHCATNDTYYEYYDDPNDLEDGWVEVKRTVTFYFTDPKSEDADKKKVLTVNYGAKPDVSIVSNPSKAEDAAATYQFQGWKSSETGTVYPYTATNYEPVTENGTYYMPVFTPITKKYTITLKDAKNGETVPVEVFYGSVPEYTATKAATAEFTYTFSYWEPELVAVTGAATYTAYWTSVKNRYNITWMNGETILEEDKNVLYGTETAYNGELPTKETDDNFVYTFSGWLNSLTGNMRVDKETVTGAITYTAQYTTTPRYAITFANYDGTQLQKESVTKDEHPIYKGLTPARVRDFDGYYKFTGWKNLSGTFYAKDATLPAATAKETYTAQYDYVTDLYYITLRNVKGQGTAEGDNIWSGWFGEGSTPFYDPNGDDIADAPTKAGNDQYTYTFDGWSLTQDGAKLEPVPEVTEAATYWALFKQSTNKYTITFANVDGNGAQRQVEVEYGQTPECPVTPAKGDNNYTYDFLGWDSEIVAVTGNKTYTAQFNGTGTPRTFTITFEPENGTAEQVLQVAYGTMPSPTTPVKDPDNLDKQYSYTFNSWYPELTTVTEDATYYAQYMQTLKRYTITFKNYDGTVLQSSSLNYGTTPSYGGTPSKPVDVANRKAYNFTGWKNSSDVVYAKNTTLPYVAKDETYTAQYSEVTFVASVTTSASVTTYYDSWSSALSAANSSKGSTLKLYANVTASNNSSVTGNFTLDLNGYEVSCTTSTTSNTRLLYVTGSLTVDDSRGGGKIYYQGSGNANYDAIYFYNSSGHLTINNGTIESKKTGGSSNRRACAIYDYYGPVTVNGGELIATSTKSAYALYDYGETTVIKGGKFKATTTGSKYILSDGSATTISGGCYSMTPNGSYTLATGCAVLSVRDDDPNGVSPAEYPYKVAAAHTVTFKNGDAIVQTGKSEDGLLPIVPADPTTPNVDGRVYSFTGWSPALAVVSADATYTAQYEVIGIDAESEAPVEITENMTVTTTTIETTGKLKVADGKTLTTTNLILNASESASGQIMETGTIKATNVYYDLKLNTDARHWHAFGVPWTVDLNTNKLVEVDNNGNVVRTLHISRDYEIMYYDGAYRAANGPSADCWKYLRHYEDTEHGQPVEELVPGRGYMIAFGSHVNIVRFIKKASAPIIFDGTVSLQAAGTGTDKGINGVSNPMAYHAKMTLAGVGQMHDGGEIGSDGYDPITIAGMNYIVGKTVYIQVENAQTISRAEGISPIVAASPAPARRAKATDKKYLTLEDYYTIALTNSNGEERKLYVLPEEEKEDKYVIGHDLVQMGMNAKKAQIWINRYDVNLCLNTTAPINEAAEFPVIVYAPNAGEYTISLASQPDDEYTVYLMRNGVVIWDLSNSAYTVKLEAGTDKTYGLRLSARKGPAITTDINEAVVDAQGKIRKVIIEDKVFIIRGNEVYTIDGQLVK